MNFELYKVKSILLYFIFFISIFKISHSQDDSLKPIVRRFVVLPSSFGYTWQGTHNLDFGVQPMLMLNSRNNHNNIAIVLTANIAFINNTSYLTPRSRLKFYKEFYHRKVAWTASIGHSYTSINAKFDHRITPEIGISLGWFHFTYGYNFKTSSYIDKVTNYNRLSIRFGIW